MELHRATEKVLLFKSERAKILSVDPNAVAQPVAIGEEKAKEDINPVILNKEPVILADDELEEEMPKLSKGKLKKLCRMTVEEVKQK
ncbi:hypothetical protein TNCT_392561 [Trichonephila clavata]|uniref:Uncharacterized protein n=1 Tax=Trichonephila clavata TaxID=2740835 RepID=A0A8X6LWN1_TRICU|nr:hypothetical protein TNCT_392561 [Trichonephila clavata]